LKAYYNEFEPNAAAWLRQLIKNGLIADGIVDERSITEVSPNDLRGFTQHHFFAGIGGWSYALRIAGWADSRPVCTASLPCQPFSVAGAGKGKDDERHLLPHFIELVRQCKPNRIFGEQVEGAIRHGWLDDLQTTMEAEGYAVGHCVLGAHSVGSFHQRQRLYWVAHSCSEGLQEQPRERNELQGFAKASLVGRMVHTDGARSQQGWSIAEATRHGYPPQSASAIGLWGKTEWIYCRDNKYRPIKSGLKPLADGIPRGVVRSGDNSEPIDANATQEARSMRLKGYGNAICPQVASTFIKSFTSLANENFN
jgi:DNA (cytosine-5)-methyltransferase 1